MSRFVLTATAKVERGQPCLTAVLILTTSATTLPVGAEYKASNRVKNIRKKFQQERIWKVEGKDRESKALKKGPKKATFCITASGCPS